jgi:hypothetical protein
MTANFKVSWLKVNGSGRSGFSCGVEVSAMSEAPTRCASSVLVTTSTGSAGLA